MNTGRVLRIGGAVALAAAGLVHLDLYFGGYRSAGSEPAFGRSILFNAIVSMVVAAAVAARREWFVRLAGILVPVGTLAAFAYTHTEHTLLGFQGAGLEPSPQAQLVLFAEIATIVLLAATFVPAIAERDESSGVPFLAAAVGVAALVSVGLGIYWADHYETTSAASAPASVAITDFAFAPPGLTVARGTTVTWTNDDPFGHSVVAADGSFTSDDLGSGESFRFAFDTAGEFGYVCGIHPEMVGTVTVTDR
jgi:plastocyanin